MQGNLVSLVAVDDVFVNGHTYVRGEQIDGLSPARAHSMVRAGRVVPLGATRGGREGSGPDGFPDPFQDPTDEQEKPMETAQGTTMETATVPTPGRPNGKPKPPKVD
jgi:hypothetical protein